MKHQSNCYRVIKGMKYENECDLIYGDTENSRIIEEVKLKWKHVRVIKHPDGFRQLFINKQVPKLDEKIKLLKGLIDRYIIFRSHVEDAYQDGILRERFTKIMEDNYFEILKLINIEKHEQE